jgi:methylglutaconyl-CoA hydratase
MTDSILYHLSDRGVATLTMNRPELHNAFDEKLIQEKNLACSKILY